MKKTIYEQINDIKSIEELNEVRDSINEACDKQMSYLTAIKKSNELSDKSFGYIKECFEHISNDLFKTNEGRKIINKYTQTIKEDKNLMKAYNIYECMRKADKGCDINAYINEAVSMIGNVDKSYKKSVKSLGNILSEAYMMLYKDNVELVNENKDYYNAVDYIISNKKNPLNLAETTNCVKVIKEHIGNNNSEYKSILTKENIENFNTLVEEFNKKYSSLLSEDEINLVREITFAEDKESVFKKYQDICMNKLHEAKQDFSLKGDIDSVNRLNEIQSKVSNKKFTLENLDNDVCKFIEITKCI